jgi:phage baseplate assembly protein W
VIAADLGRGLAFPVRLTASGNVAFSEGEANVRESIEIVLRTELGERLREPGFGAGLGASLFATNTTSTWRALEERIVFALATWESRINAVSVTVEGDAAEPETAIATITYSLVATNAPGRLAVAIPLQP